ncbi:MAG: flagellar protein FliT [Ignavibacteria bacterium]
MLLMPSQIKRYEEIGALSAQMVDAARAQDWQRLVALEKSVAELRDALMAEDDNDSLAEPERRVKAALIQRILDDDAEIRRHTEPWMEHVRQYLETAGTRRRVEMAYGGTTSRFGNPGF